MCNYTNHIKNYFLDITPAQSMPTAKRHIDDVWGDFSQFWVDALIEKEKELFNTEKSPVTNPNKSIRMTTTKTGFNSPLSAFNGTSRFYFKKNIENVLEYKEFLSLSKPEINEILSNAVQKCPLKYNLKIEARYKVPNTDITQDRSFKIASRSLFLADDINSLLEEDFVKMLGEIEAMSSKGSGFVLDRIDGLLLNTNKYTPLGGSSYIPLPAYIENKKATINVQNEDDKCFKYSLLAKFVNPNHRLIVGTNYANVEDRYNFSKMSYPVAYKDIHKFEKENPGVSINVYILKEGKSSYKYNIKEKNITKNKLNLNQNQYLVNPLKVCDEEKDDHHDLLFFGDGTGKTHYCRIINLAKLVGAQISRHGHSILLCKRCFKCFSQNKGPLTAEQRLNSHKIKCKNNKPLTPILPAPKTILNFENWGYTNKHPFAIYADFECLLEKQSDAQHNNNNTKIINQHEVMSYCYYIKTTDDISTELLEQYNIEVGPVVFRGNSSMSKGEVAGKFMDEIVKVAQKIEHLLKTNIALVMTDENVRNHRAIVDKKICPLCEKKFTDQNLPVRDHNHLNGAYRGTTCSKCNLKMHQPQFVPCYFHNLSGYDSHFIITQLGNDTQSITVIPNTEEKLISFAKYISPKFQIRFLDTFRFMESSLEKLASNLAVGDNSKFKETAKIFTPNDMSYVTRKGFYPYEYTDRWEKLDEPSLPPKEEFYSTLLERHIKDEDYEYAQRVWKHFGFKTLGEYSEWYMKVDVMLLCDVFENFRDLCLNTYGVDPSYYYTAPGMAFDCALKITKVELELLSDYDKILMVEAGIRGGLTQAVKRYAKANNCKVPDYDPSKPESMITYLDATNLYL